LIIFLIPVKTGTVIPADSGGIWDRKNIFFPPDIAQFAETARGLLKNYPDPGSAAGGREDVGVE
jgi:hypothetical protein